MNKVQVRALEQVREKVAGTRVTLLGLYVHYVTQP